MRLQRGLLVRSAVPENADELAAVHVAAWRAGYAGLVPDAVLTRLDVRARAERWRERLSEGAEEVLVGVAAGRIVGFVSHGPPRDEELARDQRGWWEVYALYVDPAYWRSGVGSRLWGTVAAGIPDTVTGLCVWVLAGNARGRAAYARWGLAPDGAERSWDPGTGPLAEIRYVGWL